MRPKVHRRFLFVLVTSISIGLSACTSITRTLTTDFFIFELNIKENYATVRRLTELGKEQEILVVPPMVDDFSVKFIGKPPKLPLLGEGMGALSLGYTVKKIYLPFSLEDRAWLTGLEGMEIILTKANPNSDLIDSIHRFSEAELFFRNDESALNTFFMLNYELAVNDGYYWMDYINGSNPYLIPSDPIREGYTFSGWYYEEDGTTLWDNQVPPSETENLTLYSKWI